MKKFLTSAVAILLVGTVAGVAYAFFTDTGSADTNSVAAGDVDLVLSKTSASAGFADTVSGVWTLANMAPGGPSITGEVWMKNIGTVDTDLMHFDVNAVTESVAGMADQLRITELEYGGESLLSGGAGADFSDYEGPFGCSVTVTSGNSIQTAIDGVVAPAVVCVDAGTYNENVNVNKSIAVIATNAPESVGNAAITGMVDVTADNAIFKGFKVIPGVVPNQEAGIGITASGVTVDSNIVTGMSSVAGGTIKGIYVYKGGLPVLSNITITNNLVEDITNSAKATLGIMVQGAVDGVTVQGNTSKDLTSPTGWYASGIDVSPTGSYVGSPLNVVIEDNHVENMGNGLTEAGKGVTIDWVNAGNTTDASEITLRRNNFVNTPVDVRNLDAVNTLDAQDNWWGDFVPETQGLVDSSNFAGGPFIGFVGGADGTNANGFADLADFEETGIDGAKPGLDAGGSPVEKLLMSLQLDGPTTGNAYQNASTDFNMDITMEQLPGA
jgi:hypothetical protein